MEFKFDPQCILRKSSRDLFGFIDPESSDVYGSSDSGRGWIEIEFRNPVPISQVEIRTAREHFPRSFDLVLTQMNGQITRREVRDADLDGSNKSQRYEFEEMFIKSIKFQQKGPNWKGDRVFQLASIELFSSSRLFASGVFGTIFGHSRTGIHKLVSITARDFDASTVHLPCGARAVSTWSGAKEWLEIDLVDHCLLLSAYRLKQIDSVRLRSWSLLGSNDRSLPLGEWEEIDSQEESERGELASFVFHARGGPFRYFRIVNTGPRWDGKDQLCLSHLELFGCLVPMTRAVVE
jgi:hypothetical protein